MTPARSRSELLSQDPIESWCRALPGPSTLEFRPKEPIHRLDATI